MAESRNEKKLKAARRAEYRLRQRLDYIDWEMDVLLPEVERLNAAAQAALELPVETTITFEWEDGDDPGKDQSKAA